MRLNVCFLFTWKAYPILGRKAILARVLRAVLHALPECVRALPSTRRMIKSTRDAQQNAAHPQQWALNQRLHEASKIRRGESVGARAVWRRWRGRLHRPSGVGNPHAERRKR